MARSGAISGHLEAQDAGRLSPVSPAAAEYAVSTSRKLAHLAVYFACNVSLTLYNKIVLGKLPYPWLLTALHVGSAAVGCSLALLVGVISLSRLSRRQESLLAAYSILFTVNVAISNASLGMVSVPFHQVMRSTCPVFTVLITRFRYGRLYSTETYISLIPVTLGVGLATYGDYYFSSTGFFLTFLGVMLASAKTVATNRLMTGPLRLSTQETLLRVSPLAFAQALGFAYASGEIDRFVASRPPASLCWALAGNGALAFVLNMASFSANKSAGALTMTVCANVKQCLTVLLGITLFNVRIGVSNGLGIVVATAGAAWYSFVEIRGGGGSK